MNYLLSFIALLVGSLHHQLRHERRQLNNLLVIRNAMGGDVYAMIDNVIDDAVEEHRALINERVGGYDMRFPMFVDKSSLQNETVRLYDIHRKGQLLRVLLDTEVGDRDKLEKIRGYGYGYGILDNDEELDVLNDNNRRRMNIRAGGLIQDGEWDF